MDRRSFLRRVGFGGVVGTAGCIGGGGKVVTNLKRTITVKPHTGWIKEIPDVSDPGGAIQYTAQCRLKFDVYFFIGKSQIKAYRSYIDMARATEDPSSTASEFPKGSQEIGQTATPTEKDRYQAATKDKGARQSIDQSGPYYFVLDNSNYPAAGGAYLGELPEPRQIDLQLTVSQKRFGLPF